MALRRHTATPMPKTLPDLLPFDTWLHRFQERYSRERSFRQIVHAYFKFSRGQRFALASSHYILPWYYRKKTESMVREYADKAYADLVAARQMPEMQEAERARKELEGHAAKVREGLSAVEQARIAVAEAARRKAEAEQNAAQKKEQREADLEQTVASTTAEIQRAADAKRIVQNVLTRHLQSSQFVKVDRTGRLTFDEKRLVQRLEDMFLTEIVEGIEREDGAGFMTKTKQRFERALSHWGEIDDPSEIDEIDWIESMMLAHARGYPVPVFPHLVVAKYMDQPKSFMGRTSVDTAISLDSSGSMEWDYRFQVAKKATMGTTSLMRQLNPKNNTYLSHFNNEVYDLSSPELLRQATAGGGTRTEKALNWMIERLKDSGPSLAYLITDGDPNDVPATIEEAKRFRDYPILLRIFLIDGNPRTEEVVREVGRAAGPRTRVIPVKYDKLAGDFLRDISASIGQMTDIAVF